MTQKPISSFQIPTGFFAYPSKPPMLGETVRQAIETLNRTQVVHVQSWEECRVGGKAIAAEICREIDGRDLLLADLTGLNPNVLFEVGYAIAKNKRIWPVLDRTIEGNDFTEFRTLSTVGCAMYESSADIIKAYNKDAPHADLQATLLARVIEPGLRPGQPPTLLYLKSQHETDASVRITRRLEKLSIRRMTDDPQEVPWQTLAWYGEQVYVAEAVACHFTSPTRQGARIRNARYALVAGMAFGMAKHLLILCEGDSDYLAPLDYREILKHYQTAGAAERHLDAWVAPLEAEWKESTFSRSLRTDSIRLATELKGLNLGEYIAENEGNRLVHGYFIETAAYREALDGTHTIFVGRKGTGKSANFLQLSAQLGDDVRNVLSVIKPVAYELESILRILGTFTDRDKKVYVIEGLWQFLLYSEIGLALKTRIDSKILAARTPAENEFVEYHGRNGDVLSGDFSSRLERCIDRLEKDAARSTGSTEEFRHAMTETLHSVVLKELRVQIVKALPVRARVATLIDNLDKAWDRQNDLSSLAEFLLGLLSAARKVRNDLQNEREGLAVSLAVFLRADIFEKVQQVAREPDKIKYTRLVWTDRELLYKLVQERFVAANDDDDTPPEVLWSRYFCPTVGGVPTKEFLAGAVLPRPRDFLYLTKSAITNAVNRGHSRVEENDIVEACKAYSEFAAGILIIEDNSDENILEKVVYEFAGAPSTIASADICKRIRDAGAPEDGVKKIIDQLCALTFLGIEVEDNDFRFPDNSVELKKVAVLARRLCESRKSEPVYQIHRAFRPFLETK